MERNITSYQLEQANNKKYFLTTCLVNDKLKLITQDSNSNTFVGAFTLSDLCNISKYFNDIKSIDQVQNYLNGIIERQMVEISENDFSVQIIVHLINTDSIIIPLINQIQNNNYNYVNTPNQFVDTNQNPITQTTNNYSNITYNYYTNPNVNKNDNQEININPMSPLKPHTIPNIQVSNSDTNLGKNIVNEINNMNLTANFSNMTYNALEKENKQNIQVNDRPKTPIRKNKTFLNTKKTSVRIKVDKTRENNKPKQEKISKEIKQLTEKVESYINEIDAYKKDKAILIEECKRI